jgi:tetratricopeptide (TPR) repeat protein
MYFNSLEGEISRLRLEGPSSELADAIQTWAGYQEFANKRKDVALGLYEEAAKLFRLLGNRSRLAESLLDAGRILYHLHRLDDARSTLQEALQEFEAVSNARGSARTHNFLALVADRAGDKAESRSQREQASEIAPDDNTRGKIELEWIRHAD